MTKFGFLFLHMTNAKIWLCIMCEESYAMGHAWPLRIESQNHEPFPREMMGKDYRNWATLFWLLVGCCICLGSDIFSCPDINFSSEKFEVLTSILKNQTEESVCLITKIDAGHVTKLDTIYPGDDMIEQRTLSMQFGEKTTGISPVFAAVASGNEAIFVALAAQGANCDVHDSNGVPLLVLAARAGKVTMLSMILERGVSVNVRTRREGQTALISAIKEGHIDAAIYLLDKQADPSIKTHGLARNALMIAVIQNNLPLVTAILATEKAEVNARDRDGTTALIFACEKNHEDIALLLINQPSININMQQKDGHSPLILAAAKVGGNLKVVKALIEKKADLDLRLHDGRSALIAATMYGHEEIAVTLIEAGASLDFDAIYAHTALIIACHEGHEKIAKSLIEHGAKTNFQDKQGRTALMMAALRGNYNLVQALLDIKPGKVEGTNRKREVPSVGLKDLNGHTAAMLAKSHGFQDCFHLILTREKEHHEKNLRVMQSGWGNG